MQDCLFCKIVRREAPADIVYEDEEILSFKDINPVAPVHVLLITKKHIDELTALEDEDAMLIGRLHLAAKKVAEKLGLTERGFRLVNNCKAEGGQVIYHLHFHLLGGRKMRAMG